MTKRAVTLLCTALLAGCPSPESARDGTRPSPAGGGPTPMDRARSEVPVPAMKAAARAARSSGDLKRAVRYWKRVVTAEPTPGHALGYARVLRARGDGEQAYIVLDDNRADSPSADYLGELGKAALAAGYPERALDALRPAVEKAPDRAMLRSVKAVAMARAGQSKKALIQARMAVEYAGERVFAPGLNLALLQAQTGNIEAARTTLRNLADRPGAPEAVDRALETVELIAGKATAADGTLSRATRRALRGWITGAKQPTVGSASGDGGANATWYVRVTAPDAYRTVFEALQQDRPETGDRRDPVRIRYTRRQAADGRTVVLAPVRGWRSARRVCRDIRDDGATCQIGHRDQVARGGR